MPLLLDGQPYHPASCELLQVFAQFKTEAEDFCKKATRHCAPQDLLYVNQREYAVTSPQDDVVRVLGSDDATTCHIIVIRHSGSGATGLAHLDGHGMKDGIADMITGIEALSTGSGYGRLELHLFGGFCDDRLESRKISREVLTIFHNCPQEVHLVTACFTDLNDVVKDGIHWPILYGVAIDVRSGEIFPATFADKGPDGPLRSVYTLFGDQKMRNVYDHSTGRHMITPFKYRIFSEAFIWLKQPDAVIRENLSTSPAVEPPYFEQHIRNALQWVIDNPTPSKTVFPGGKPRVYNKDKDGRWVAMATSSSSSSS